MPKFTPEQDAKIKSTLDLTMGQPTVPLPVVKFSKSKKAKTYIPNGENLYQRAVLRMCKEGFPLEFEVHSTEKLLFTKTFWEPLGVSCTLNLSPEGKTTALLDQTDPEGSLPRHVFAERERNLSAKASRERSFAAVKKIHKLTQTYMQQIETLVAEAGVSMYRRPGFKFIDFSRRPYRCFPRAQPNLRIDQTLEPEEFTTDIDFNPYLWEYKY